MNELVALTNEINYDHNAYKEINQSSKKRGKFIEAYFIATPKPYEKNQYTMALDKSSTQQQRAKENYVANFKKKTGVIKQRVADVMRTIYLPKENYQELRMQSEELNGFKGAQMKFYEEFITGIDRDKVVREEEFRLMEDDSKFCFRV